MHALFAIISSWASFRCISRMFLFVFTPHRMIVDSQVVIKVLINEVISHFVTSELTLLMRQDDHLLKTRKRHAFDKLSVVLIPPGDVMHAFVTFLTIIMIRIAYYHTTHTIYAVCIQYTVCKCGLHRILFAKMCSIQQQRTLYHCMLYFAFN